MKSAFTFYVFITATTLVGCTPHGELRELIGMREEQINFGDKRVIDAAVAQSFDVGDEYAKVAKLVLGTSPKVVAPGRSLRSRGWVAEFDWNRIRVHSTHESVIPMASNSWTVDFAFDQAKLREFKVSFNLSEPAMWTQHPAGLAR
ncbi:MAG: hypothetical protein JNG88_02075 [Phycisphaerales bacterium]|nr:hypothetical protein [Phycisphaerales bacterium]